MSDSGGESGGGGVGGGGNRSAGKGASSSSSSSSGSSSNGGGGGGSGGGGGGSEHDEKLAQFVAVTGVSEDVANHWLEANAYSVESAVNMFMESGGEGAVGGEARGEGGGVSGMGEEGTSWPGGASHGMGGDVGSGPYPGDPDYVRPADPYKRQRLVDDTRSHGYGGMSTMRPWGGAPTTAAIPFRDFAQESRQASNAFATKGSDRSSNPAVNEKQRKLAKMFSPPTELMFMGDFQAARQAAKQQKKWLLVNIQADGEFDCHRLNRDVWKDEMVQNIIQCNCIFWQQPSVSEEAKVYCRRYSATGYPHMALVDPRTGMKVWSFQGFLESPEFIEKVTDVTDKISLEDGAPARLPPPPPRPPQLPPSTGGSEDQMLAAAIAASLDTNSRDGSQEFPLDAVDSSGGGGGSGGSDRHSSLSVSSAVAGEGEAEVERGAGVGAVVERGAAARVGGGGGGREGSGGVGNGAGGALPAITVDDSDEEDEDFDGDEEEADDDDDDEVAVIASVGPPPRQPAAASSAAATAAAAALAVAAAAAAAAKGKGKGKGKAWVAGRTVAAYSSGSGAGAGTSGAASASSGRVAMDTGFISTEGGGAAGEVVDVTEEVGEEGRRAVDVSDENGAGRSDSQDHSVESSAGNGCAKETGGGADVGEVLEDPPADDSTDRTSIRFQFPTGARVLRKFRKSSDVRQLFLFVREELDGAKTRAFDVRTVRPPISVRDKYGISIHEAGLSNSAVVVVWED